MYEDSKKCGTPSPSESNPTATTIAATSANRLSSLCALYAELADTARHKIDALMGEYGPSDSEEKSSDTKNCDSIPPLLETSELINLLERQSIRIATQLKRL